MKRLNVEREHKRIYCELTLPDNVERPCPAVILAHGLGSTHAVNDRYAHALAKHGIAAVSFDFCGGGPGSQSDGDVLEMSVLTEAADLCAVLDAVKAVPEIDGDRCFLMGSSQGGFVASYVAGKRPEAVCGLILLYPAYVLQAGLRDAKDVDVSALPATFDIGGLTVGRQYILDAASFDIYEEMAAFEGPVLLLHGDADKIVPLAFSQRAAQVYAHAEMAVLNGAGHGFHGEHEAEAIGHIRAFIDREIGEA